MNAVRNGDLQRAVEVLEAIHDECVPASSTAGRSPRARAEIGRKASHVECRSSPLDPEGMEADTRRG
jgi:hypothetical protein